MQQINTEYAFMSAKVIKGANLSDEEAENEILSSEAYRKAIEHIIHLDGITIELVGYWIWVTGQKTYIHRATLKAAGFFFAPKKLAWYFRTEEYKVSKGGKKSLDEIRNKYGSEVLNEDKRKRNNFIK
jgi:hypothetical protein